MRGLEIAALVLLAGWCVSTPTSANPASAFPHSLAAGTAHGDVLLVQYGGGGGDDDDRPSGGGNQGYQQPYHQPYQQPQQQHRNNNNNNGAAAAGAIIGIIGGVLQEQQRQKRNQEYDDNLRRQRKHQQDIANQRRQDAVRKKKADADRIERIKREERIKQLEDAKREERIKQLEDAKRDAQKKAPVYPSENQNQPQPDYQPAVTERDNNPYVDVDDNKNVINVVPAPDNCPDNFAQLKIGPTVLYPRRTDYPADPSLCAGRTGKGCYLRVVNGPATCGGGSRPVCVAYCGTPAPPPVIKRADPPPVVTPPPAKYVDPVPTPVVVPPPTKYVEPIPTPVPPVKTDKAITVVEEEHKQPVPPVKTDKAVTVVEEEHKQPVPPVKTDKAITVVEEEHKQPVPPVKTDRAITVVEEEHKQPVPPVKTDKAEKVVEVEHKQPVPPAKTDKAITVVEKKPADEPQKTADSGDQGGQLDEAIFNQPFQPPPPAGENCWMKYINGRYMTLNLSNWQQDPDYLKCEARNQKAADEKKKQDEEVAVKKKEDDDWKKFVDNPGPLDSKGCTVRGDIPLKTLVAAPDYADLVRNLEVGSRRLGDPLVNLIKDNERTIVTSGAGLIPTVGKPLSAVLSLLWKDPENGELFNKMKEYVDKLVPESINKERVSQMGAVLGGLKENLEDYVTGVNLNKKGQRLVDLNGALTRHEREILNDRTPPERALALVVAYGVLRLTALREQIQHEKDYYGDDADVAGDIDKLNKEVKKFADVAADLKKKIIVKRLDKVRVNEDRLRENVCAGSDEFFSCNFQETDPIHTAVDDMCDWRAADHTGWGSNLRPMADADVAARKELLRKTYERDLDALLDPIAHWPSMTTLARSADASGQPLPRPVAQLDDAFVDDAKSPVKTDKAAR